MSQSVSLTSRRPLCPTCDPHFYLLKRLIFNSKSILSGCLHHNSYLEFQSNGFSVVKTISQLVTFTFWNIYFSYTKSWYVLVLWISWCTFRIREGGSNKWKTAWLDYFTDKRYFTKPLNHLTCWILHENLVLKYQTTFYETILIKVLVSWIFFTST